MSTAKFLVELWLDGYDSEEKMIAACEEFIYEQLNMTASSVKIKRVLETKEKETVRDILNRFNLDCGDNSCDFAKDKSGMRTNGGCRCIDNLSRSSVRMLIMMLKARAEFLEKM